MRFGGVVPCGILLVAGLRVLSGGRCTTVAFVLSVAGRFPLGVISLLVYLSLWVNSNTWGQQCQEGREKIINPPLGDGAGLWGHFKANDYYMVGAVALLPDPLYAIAHF